MFDHTAKGMMNPNQDLGKKKKKTHKFGTCYQYDIVYIVFLAPFRREGAFGETVEM